MDRQGLTTELISNNGVPIIINLLSFIYLYNYNTYTDIQNRSLPLTAEKHYDHF